LMALPFMLLALRSPFYRERFYGCFRLPGMGEQEGGAGEPKGNSWPARERESRGVGGD
jgi:hypothetical protein